MAEIILFILLALFVFLLLVLLLPIRILVRAAGGTDAELRGSGRVMLLAGLLGGGGEYADGTLRMGLYLGAKRVYTVDASRFSRTGREEQAEDREKKRKKKKDAAGEGACPPKKPPLGERIRRGRLAVRKYAAYAGIALREIPSLFAVDRFSATVTIGFGDPAKTGQMLGAIYAVNGLLPAQYSIRPAGEFTREVFRGDADIRVTFRTWRFWIHLVRAVWSYRRLRRDERAAMGENLAAQEA